MTKTLVKRLVTLIEAIMALGIALAVYTAGFSAATAGIIAAMIALISVAIQMLLNILLPDETGSGVVFYEYPCRREIRMTSGCGWWIHGCTDGDSNILWFQPYDGHHMMT